jgi:hypothetical protein
LDGQYLFRDYETTLAYIREADGNTSRKAAPLYALWLLSESVEDLLGLIEQHLNGVGCAHPMPPGREYKFPLERAAIMLACRLSERLVRPLHMPCEPI